MEFVRGNVLVSIRFWFRQNLLIFVQRSHLSRLPELARAYQPESGGPLSLVHPELYIRRIAVHPQKQ